MFSDYFNIDEVKLSIVSDEAHERLLEKARFWVGCQRESGKRDSEIVSYCQEQTTRVRGERASLLKEKGLRGVSLDELGTYSAEVMFYEYAEYSTVHL